ncbi:MAG: hypothetical protein Kow00124_32280 [Anaerolineae bacterium]
MMTKKPEYSGPLQHADTDALMAVLAALQNGQPPAGEYARGVCDMLRLLGLLHGPTGSPEPSDRLAGLLIDSLAAHLADGVPVELPPLVDLLRAIETLRMERVLDAAPARVVQVTQAVIKRRIGGVDHYLMQYDAAADWFQPLGGKCDPDDLDSAAALRREIGEELGLDAPPGPDDCALTPLLLGWQTRDLSATYGVLTAYTMDFYHLTAIRFPLETDRDTRWLARAEIAAGRARDGRPISDIYLRALGLPRLDALAESAVLRP